MGTKEELAYLEDERKNSGKKLLGLKRKSKNFRNIPQSKSK
jgi:hypothetical protein